MPAAAFPAVLIGPRVLEKRICRFVYIRETEEAWAEEWREGAWVRAEILARHLMKAPPATRRALARAGIRGERGDLDAALACA